MVHDLTTTSGLKKSYDYYGLIYISPVLALGKYIVDKFMGEKTSPEEQRRTAKELIEEARKRGAKNIELEVGPDVDIEISLPIDIPIKGKVKAGNKTRVRIEF